MSAATNFFGKTYGGDGAIADSLRVKDDAIAHIGHGICGE